jgi:hypothetical protein
MRMKASDAYEMHLELLSVGSSFVMCQLSIRWFVSFVCDAFANYISYSLWKLRQLKVDESA